MFGKNQISDRDLLKQINQRMARTGTASQSKVNVTVQQGNVTLTGTLQHAIQRDPILKAVSRVTGVRRVIDQMQHQKKATRRDADQNVYSPQRDDVVESPAASGAGDAPIELPTICPPTTASPADAAAAE